MNIYKPFILTVENHPGDTDTLIVKDYALSMTLAPLAERLYKQEITAYYVHRIAYEAMEKHGDYVSGFLLWPKEQTVLGLDNKGYYAIDLRVNEGMCFAADTKEELRNQIESYLHSCALEYQKELDRKAAQAARGK